MIWQAGINGMSLGHHVIVMAFHLIGSGDGIVGLMALHIKHHTHKMTVQLYIDLQAVKKSYFNTQLKLLCMVVSIL